MHACTHVVHMHMQVSTETRRGQWIPEAGLTCDCESQGHWELNSSSLPEHPETFLQPPDLEDSIHAITSFLKFKITKF